MQRSAIINRPLPRPPNVSPDLTLSANAGEEGSDRLYVYHLEFVLHDIRNMKNAKKIG